MNEQTRAAALELAKRLQLLLADYYYNSTADDDQPVAVDTVEQELNSDTCKFVVDGMRHNAFIVTIEEY